MAIFARPPALHRFPKAMAGRVQELCRVLVDRYDGDAAELWADVADGRELLRRIAACRASARRRRRSSSRCSASGTASRRTAGGRPPAATATRTRYRSVADVTDAESLRRVRAHKQQVKAAAKADRG